MPILRTDASVAITTVRGRQVPEESLPRCREAAAAAKTPDSLPRAVTFAAMIADQVSATFSCLVAFPTMPAIAQPMVEGSSTAS